MNILNFKVQSQTISCTKRAVIADGQAEWVKMAFTFADDWKPLNKTVQIKQIATTNYSQECCCYGKAYSHDSTYNCYLGTEDTECYLPSEIENGAVEISVFGYDTDNAVRATTVPCKITVRKSGFVSGGTTPIPPTKDLYEQIIEEIDKKASSIQDGADGDSAYEIAVKNGFTGSESEWLASLKGTDGANGTNGVDGFSPTASVTQSDTGALITITDKSGTTTANILNGTDGKDGTNGTDGEKGADGISPTVTVTKTDTGATISITDINGTTTADLTNGVIGKDGVSPTASVAQTDTGATVTVTDANGTTTANLTNGKDGTNGTDGKDGEKGEQGEAGKDGVSPTATVEETASGAKITITDASGTTTATVANGKDGEDGTDLVFIGANGITVTKDGNKVTITGSGSTGGGSSAESTLFDFSSYTDASAIVTDYSSKIYTTQDAGTTWTNLTAWDYNNSIVGAYYNSSAAAGIDFVGDTSKATFPIGLYGAEAVNVSSPKCLICLKWFVSAWINPTFNIHLIDASIYTADTIQTAIKNGSYAYSKSVTFYGSIANSNFYVEADDIPLGDYYVYLEAPQNPTGNEAIITKISLLSIK